jgi:hypothetical protein
MKILRLSALMLVAMSLVSCVASLLPLFEDRYLVMERGLIGTWKGGDSGADTWTFEKADANEYLLTQHQAEFEEAWGLGQPSKKVAGDTARFQARLGRLGGSLFLDFSPADEGNPKVHNDWLNAHLIPAHTLARVWLGQDSLKLCFLDQDWATKAIESGRIKLAHVKTDQWLVLTAPTAEIESFIVRFAEDANAFPPSGVEELRRAK